MSPIPTDLEDLRRRIDEIDDKLQDLLIERFEIVLHVATQKRNGSLSPHQPAREAEIIRRLIARNHSPLPPSTLVRIWRELLAGTTRLQGQFAVAVFAPTEMSGLWDIARDHYGSHTPLLAFQSPGPVIRAVTEGQAAVGVLPMPQEEDAAPWWRLLVSADDNAPRVIARLPFGPRGNVRTDRVDALAIGHGTQRETGQDRTLLATENALDISRGRIFAMLSALGLECTFLASCQHAEGANTLIELDGFIGLADPRLEGFRAQLGPALYRLISFGGYAVPLHMATPSTARPPLAPLGAAIRFSAAAGAANGGPDDAKS